MAVISEPMKAKAALIRTVEAWVIPHQLASYWNGPYRWRIRENVLSHPLHKLLDGFSGRKSTR
jgi:hypothetical protein